MFILQALAQSRRRALQPWRSLPLWIRHPIRRFWILFHVKRSQGLPVAGDWPLRQGLREELMSRGSGLR